MRKLTDFKLLGAFHLQIVLSLLFCNISFNSSHPFLRKGSLISEALFISEALAQTSKNQPKKKKSTSKSASKSTVSSKKSSTSAKKYSSSKSYSKTKSIKKYKPKTSVKVYTPKPKPTQRPKTAEVISTSRYTDNSLRLTKTPSLAASYLDRRYAKNQNGDFVFFTVNPELQDLAEQIVDDNNASHVAVVAIEPQSGKILALAEKSALISDLSIHAGFPAASLFKVITAAAALDTGSLNSDAKIRFRGGNYELSQLNYSPSVKGDKRSMSIGEALGKSCNPVFGRIALNYLEPKTLEKYAFSFGFGSQIPYEVNLPISQVSIPSGSYELSRTGAGFGDVTISPVHAATLMAALANQGIAYKPHLIDKIISPEGNIIHSTNKAVWTRMISAKTSNQLMDLMINTTTIGTSRKEFIQNSTPVLGRIRVAGKTGTLRGKNPLGLNNWFIGAPVEDPKIAVAAIVVDPDRVTTKASRMGRLMIQKFLQMQSKKQ